MALNPCTPQILQFSFRSPSNSAHCLFFSDLTSSHILQSPPPWPQLQIGLKRSRAALGPVAWKVNCLAKSTEEERWTEPGTLTSNSDELVEPDEAESQQNSVANVGAQRTPSVFYSDSISLGIREPVYEVCAPVLSVCSK